MNKIINYINNYINKFYNIFLLLNFIFIFFISKNIYFYMVNSYVLLDIKNILYNYFYNKKTNHLTFSQLNPNKKYIDYESYYRLKPYVINIPMYNNNVVYKVNISLSLSYKLSSLRHQNDITRNLNFINKVVNSYISMFTIDRLKLFNLRSYLKENILKRINKKLTYKINNIYITDFLITKNRISLER